MSTTSRSASAARTPSATTWSAWGGPPRGSRLSARGKSSRSALKRPRPAGSRTAAATSSSPRSRRSPSRFFDNRFSGGAWVSGGNNRPPDDDVAGAGGNGLAGAHRARLVVVAGGPRPAPANPRCDDREIPSAVLPDRGGFERRRHDAVEASRLRELRQTNDPIDDRARTPGSRPPDPGSWTVPRLSVDFRERFSCHARQHGDGNDQRGRPARARGRL